MNGLTLKHLRYFTALARHGHFGRAAEACGISQPALSTRIKELETMLGAPLVERRARAVQVTPLGAQFLDRATRILAEVGELDGLARATEGPYSGPLRLGVIPTVAPYLLPALITALARRNPALDLRPRESVTGMLISDLLDARLDAALVALPISEPALHEMPLLHERFALVRPKRDAHLPVPSPEALRTMRLLLLEEGHCFRDQALEFCSRSASAPRDLMEGSSLSTLVQMVGAGIGVTLIPEMAVPLETARAPVCTALFPPPGPGRTIGLVWRRTSPLAARLSELGAVVRDVAAGRRADADAQPPGVF